MEIPKKFEVNTEDFKIYFDNNKKTHICENLETGEKTNIGVIGIFLQMGIIRPIEEKTDDRIKSISEKLSSLEMKLDEIARNINGIVMKSEEKREPVIEEEVEERPKSEIRERIMKRVLKQAEEEPEESDVVTESEEEIENWSEI